MLSADFGHLERDTQMIDRSADEWVHIDVMDGVFVPNISFGFPVLKAIRKATAKCLDVHLMIVEPERYVARFAEAGADVVDTALSPLAMGTSHPATESIVAALKGTEYDTGFDLDLLAQLAAHYSPRRWRS